MEPATRYLEMNPGIEDRGSVQREIVRSLKLGDWVVEWEINLGNNPNASKEPGAVLFERWQRQRASVRFQNLYYRVLRVAARGSGIS